MGDKNCQWILGILYLKGSGVKQDGLEGLAWMTVAVESEKEEWVEIYDKVMEQLPAETRAVVEQAGRKYIELYGMSAQNVYCTRRADTGSHIARVVCNKQRW
jgi:TPR repeat protein